MDKRFDIFLDPFDLWTVWDNQNDVPAFFADRMLIDLTRSEAEAACLLLNEAEANRLAEYANAPAKSENAA